MIEPEATDPPPLETDIEPDPSALGPGPGGAADEALSEPFAYANQPDSLDGQVSRPGPRIDTQEVSPGGKTALERYLERQHCPESVGGHRPGRDGRCEWCSRRVAAAMPMPDLSGYHGTNLGDSYRYYYEPDWGSDRYDT